MKPQGSFSIKVEWLRKMLEQTFEQGKYLCALAFRFNPDIDSDWYVIPEVEFLEYLRWKESQND